MTGRTIVSRAGVRRAVLLLVLLLPAALVAQPVPTADTAPAAVDERLQLAIADPAYPVTPGDVYELTFLQGAVLVTTRVIVESSYQLNMGIFGTVNGSGKTFAALKPEVETIIANAYPRGLPSLNIAAVGVFRVNLAGAIPRSIRVSVWGLSRLTDVLPGTTGPFTSLREVAVRSASGETTSYDVFRAIHSGDVSQDPLLRPGDTIVFRRRGTTVTVEGQVYEPETYELLTGEGLAQLEEFFQGFRPRADTLRLVIERQTGESVRQLSIGSPEEARSFVFQDGDVLIVPTRTVPRPVVYIEGAVDTAFIIEPQESLDSSIPLYNRVSVPLTAGDTLYSLLIDAQDRVSPFADIERGYVIRQDSSVPIQVNFRQVLYRESEYADLVLAPFDRIVIPFDQPFVVVTGGVDTPGRYPYTPFESVTYYLSLAGTDFESLAAVSEGVRVFDRDGNEIGADTTILPGYTISVPESAVQERFVVVSGDVPAPGAYPYDSTGTIASYTRRAGLGANALAVARDTIQVFDADGTAIPAGRPIEPEFTIHVPPREVEQQTAFVLVTGAVNAPGPYGIAQEATASYYILLAGGVNTEISADGSYTIVDAQGQRRPSDALPRPGDTIEVARNGFLYNFGRYFPVITAGLTFITTIITIVNALNP